MPPVKQAVPASHTRIKPRKFVAKLGRGIGGAGDASPDDILPDEALPGLPWVRRDAIRVDASTYIGHHSLGLAQEGDGEGRRRGWRMSVPGPGGGCGKWCPSSGKAANLAQGSIHKRSSNAPRLFWGVAEGVEPK